MMHPDADAFDETEHAEIELRILDGPQLGAKMALREARYVLGHGAACDVYLADDSAAEAHLALTFRDDKVTAEALEQRVALTDRWLEAGESADLVLPTTLAIGGTTVGIGAAQADWSALTPPDPSTYPPADSEASAEALPEPDTSATTGTSEEAAQSAVPAPQGLGPMTAEPAEPAPRGGNSRLLLGGAVALALLVGAGVYVAVGPNSDGGNATTSAVSEQSLTDVLARARSILRTKSFPSVTASLLPDGSGVRLTGVVRDGAALDRLRSVVDESSMPLVIQVRDATAMAASIRTALQAYNWPEPGFGDHLSVVHREAGLFDVAGYLGTRVDRSALRRLVLGEVPGVTEVRFNNATLSHWRGVLDQRIKDAGLGQWLHVAEEEDELRIAGDLSSAEVAIWREVGQAFVDETGGWPQLRIAVRQIQPDPVAPPPSPEPDVASEPTEIVEGPDELRPNIDVVGVIVVDGGKSAVLLGDGETLHLGDKSDDGALVVDISSELVRFQIDQYYFTYHLRKR